MKKAMISQPMAGKSDEEIASTKGRATRILQGEGYEVLNTLFNTPWYGEAPMKSRGIIQNPLYFLAKSLEIMSLCHVVYFCKGWDGTRGCRLEHTAAIAYGLDIIYEK